MRGWCAARAALHRSQRASLARLAMPAAGRARERCRAGAWRASVAEIWTRRTAGAARLEQAPVWRSNGVWEGGGPRESRAAPRGPVALRVAYWAVRGRYVAQRVRIHAIIRTHRAEPTRVHDRSTSRRRERRCVEVPRPAAAACRNGALEGAAVAAERADSAIKFDGVPAVGPDEGAAGSD